jgi:hypothetical protein
MQRFRVARTGRLFGIHDDLLNQWVMPINSRGNGAVRDKARAEKICAEMEAARDPITLDADVIVDMMQQGYEQGFQMGVARVREKMLDGGLGSMNMGEWLRHRTVKLAKEFERKENE